jgi:glycolate oxidase FAD binding subunit
MKPSRERLQSLFGAEAVGVWERRGPAHGALAVAPASLEAAGEVLRAAESEGWSVLPAGAGEHPGVQYQGRGVDVVLTARNLDRVLEYEPAEAVLVAQAGLTLHALDALVAPHGQRLKSDVHPGRAATLGGAVAAGRDGLNRRAAGSLRDALLGVRVVHADGRTSKTGGKVVKNVAGFDLGKLYTGSCGSLAWLGEINVRLAPRPEASALVVASLPALAAHAALLALHRSPLAPVASLLVAGSAAASLAVPAGQTGVALRFEGREVAVRDAVTAAATLVGGAIWEAEPASAAYEALRAGLEPRDDAVLVRIGSLPTAGVALVEALAPLAAWQTGGGCVVQFGVGITHAQLPGLMPRAWRELQARCTARGWHASLLDAPAGFEFSGPTPVDPVVADLVHRIKKAFDPAGCLPAPPGSAP